MLTYTQQKEIQDGEIKPDIPLIILMGLVLNDFMVTFRNDVKIIPVLDEADPPVSINHDAVQYRSQMLNLITRVSNSDAVEFGRMVLKFNRIFIAIIGQTNTTYAQIKEAEQSVWESFLNNKIQEIFEQVAGTTKEGKAEYDGITI